MCSRAMSRAWPPNPRPESLPRRTPASPPAAVSASRRAPAALAGRGIGHGRVATLLTEAAKTATSALSSTTPLTSVRRQTGARRSGPPLCRARGSGSPSNWLNPETPTNDEARCLHARRFVRRRERDARRRHPESGGPRAQRPARGEPGAGVVSWRRWRSPERSLRECARPAPLGLALSLLTCGSLSTPLPPLRGGRCGVLRRGSRWRLCPLREAPRPPEGSRRRGRPRGATRGAARGGSGGCEGHGRGRGRSWVTPALEPPSLTSQPGRLDTGGRGGLTGVERLSLKIT